MRLIDRIRKVVLWRMMPWFQCSDTGVHDFTIQFRYARTAFGDMVRQTRLHCRRCDAVADIIRTVNVPFLVPPINEPMHFLGEDEPELSATDWHDELPIMPKDYGLKDGGKS